MRGVSLVSGIFVGPDLGLMILREEAFDMPFSSGLPARYCSCCMKKLSRYNTEMFCFACQIPGVKAKVDKSPEDERRSHMKHRLKRAEYYREWYRDKKLREQDSTY